MQCSAVAEAPPPVAGLPAPPISEREPEKLKFDTEFQAKIAALLIHDPQFVQHTDGLIKA